MKLSRIACIASAATLAALTTPAQASLTTVSFRGVTDADSDPLYAGLSLSGSFAYDSALAPDETLDTDGDGTIDFAVFHPTNTLTINGPTGTQTFDGYRFRVRYGIGEGGGPVDTRDFSLSSDNDTTSAQLQFELPYAPYSAGLPTSFTADGLAIVDGTPGSYGGAVVFQAGAAAVPEPASWAMMIVGMGALGGAMRRRTRSVLATA